MTRPLLDQLLALKPILTALALPATSGLLFVMLMLLWAWRRVPASGPSTPLRLPLVLAFSGCLGLWLLSCQAVAIWLSVHLLPQVAALKPQDLKHHHVQAIVVLGGGVEQHAAEYGGPVLSPDAMSRLLYGVHLAQASKLPLAYSGGTGWAGETAQMPEAKVAALSLSYIGGPSLRWQENQSRDTRENALYTAQLLKADGVSRVALVTHAWHMPRSVQQFEAAGLVVTPAPMGYVRSDARPLLQWLPSGTGLRDSAWVIREWLGLLVNRIH